MKRHLSFIIALGAALVAAACGFQHASSVTSPTSPSTTATGVLPSSGLSLLGTWKSQTTATVPTPTSCTHLQWSITSQTATGVAGTFSADCANGLTITGGATGQLTSSTTALITVTGTASLPGNPSCAFSLSGTGTVEDNASALRIPYTGTTCLGPVSGSEVLRKSTPAPAPAPTPTPTPTPTPAPSPTPTPSVPGNFDLNAVTIVGRSPDVRSWAVTSRITSLWFGGGTIHIEHTKTGQWPPVVIAPDGTSQEATIWVFFNINGRWYGTGGERLRPGQTEKGLGQPSDIATGWFYSDLWAPMTGYVPRPGEIVGFMVTAGSTRADFNTPVLERSAVVLVPFPADGVFTSFPPFAWQEP